MNETVAYAGGEWRPRPEVAVDLGDRGFYLGDAVFDLFRTFDGRPFRIEDHADRFMRSLSYVRIDPGLSRNQIIALGEECVARNEAVRGRYGDWSVWFGATRGLAGWRRLDAPPTVIIHASQVPFDSFADQYADGASAVVTRSRNHSHQSLEPKLKHTSRMHLNLADLEARDVDDRAWPILLDAEGNVAEGSGSNVFIVSGGALATPGDHSILQGVTRTVVMELARGLGLEVREETIQPYDLYAADEVFMTSTPFCVLPVTRVDMRPVGDGRPGPVARQLLSAFGEMVGLDVAEQALRFRDSRSNI